MMQKNDDIPMPPWLANLSYVKNLRLQLSWRYCRFWNW